MRHVDMTDSQSLKPQNGSVLVFLASLQHHQHLVAITLQKVRVLQHTEATQLISDLLASIYMCVFRPHCMYTCIYVFCFQTTLHVYMLSMFSDQLAYMFSMFSDQSAQNINDFYVFRPTHICVFYVFRPTCIHVFYVFRPTCTLFSMFSDQLI